MLSINVLDEAVIRLGVFTVGKKKEFEFIVPTKSDDSLSVLQMRSLMLKLPIISFFSGESFSNNKDIKLSTTLRIDTLHFMFTAYYLLCVTIFFHQPWELGKKYDGSFIFTFAVVKVRYDGITTAKIGNHENYGNYLK